MTCLEVSVYKKSEYPTRKLGTRSGARVNNLRHHNPKSPTQNPKSKTQSPKPQTQNRKPETENRKSF